MTNDFPNVLEGLNYESPFNLLPNEPSSYTSSQIGNIFFKETKEESYWNGNLLIYNESFSITLPSTNNNLDTSVEANELEEVVITVSASTKKKVRYKIFISNDGEKLRYLANNMNNGRPESDEVLIFIEGDDDTFSQRLMRFRIGSDVTVNEDGLRELVGAYAHVSSQQIDELLSTVLESELNFAQKFLMTISKFAGNYNLVFKVLSGGLKLSIETIDKLKIKEKYWNPKIQTNKEGEIKQDRGFKPIDVFDGIETSLLSAESFLNEIDQKLVQKLTKKSKGVNSFNSIIGSAFSRVLDLVKVAVSVYKKIFEFFKSYSLMQISVVCGLWNGIVDMISGLLFLIKLAVDGGKVATNSISKGAKFVASKEEQQLVLEQLDNFVDSLPSLSDLKDIFFKVVEEIGIFVSEISFVNIWNWIKETGGKIKEKLTLSIYEIGYYGGYIATFFIPMAWIANLLGKAGKAGKAIGKALLWVDEFMAKIFGVVLKGAKNVLVTFGRILRAIVKKFKQGKQFFFDTIESIFMRIRKWLDDNFPKWRAKIKLTEFQKARKEIIRKVKEGEIKLNEFSNTIRKGNFGEMVTDDLLETNIMRIGKNEGYFKRIALDVVKGIDDKISRGIDGVFEFTNPPPKYIVTESKFGSSKLSSKITKSGGSQMSEDWVTYGLKGAIGDPDLILDIILEGYTPILAEISEDGAIELFEVFTEKDSAKKGAEFIYDLIN